jgi:hypothetical protein
VGPKSRSSVVIWPVSLPRQRHAVSCACPPHHLDPVRRGTHDAGSYYLLVASATFRQYTS